MQAEIPDFILELSKQLNEQPNRCTAHPFYQVRFKKRYVTAEDYNCDLFEIISRDGDGVVWSEGQEEDVIAEYLAENYPEWVREQFEDYVDDDSDLKEVVMEHFEFDCSELPDELSKIWIQEIDEVVSTHLTLDAAEQFIQRKKHDYSESKLFTYAESAYWSPQLRELHDWLKQLTQPAP